MASLNARKPFRVVVHTVVDGRDIVVRRLRFATSAEANAAYDELRPTLPEDQFAEVVPPLPFEGAA